MQVVTPSTENEHEYKGNLNRATSALKHLGATPEVAEEIAQVACVRSWLRPPRRSEAATSYIVSIAVRQFYTEARHKVDQFPDDFDPAAPSTLPYHIVQDIQNALNCCTRRQRRLVQLVFWEGREIWDAAAQLGMTRTAAYTQMYLAKGKMREFLAPAYASTR